MTCRDMRKAEDKIEDEILIKLVDSLKNRYFVQPKSALP